MPDRPTLIPGDGALGSSGGVPNRLDEASRLGAAAIVEDSELEIADEPVPPEDESGERGPPPIPMRP